MKQLIVKALGPGSIAIQRDGDEAPERLTRKWEKLPRRLFFFFIDNPLVTRDEIFENFWPHLSVKEATNVFHVTKRKITGLLGDEELTDYSVGFYRISGNFAVRYDVHEFERRAAMLLYGSPSEIPYEAWRELASLYTDGFLTTIDAPWVLQRREQLQKIAVDVYVATARIAPKPDIALNYLTRARTLAPLREDAALLAMQLLAQELRVQEAKAIYRDLRVGLEAQLKIKPMKALRDYYEELSK